MKKVFLTLAVVAVAALGMTSCSDEPCCWKITVTGSQQGISVTQEGYVWQTREAINADIENAKQTAKEYGLDNIKITKKKVNKNQSDCALANAGLATE